MEKIVAKADGEEDDTDPADGIADQLDLAFAAGIAESITPILKEMVQVSAAQALNQVAAVAKVNTTLDDLLDQADVKAIAWAEVHGAQMVGKTIVDGELVDNPDSRWVIEDATRDMIRDKISQALKEGWSKDKLARQLSDGKDSPLSIGRARNIAQTELGFAHSEGNRIGWATSGRIIGRYSVLSADHVGPDVCDDNAEAGIIPMDEPYPSGDEGYPFHPGCECVEIAVLDDEATADMDEEAA